MFTTVILLTTLAQFPNAATSARPAMSPAEQAVAQTSARVGAIRNALKEPGLSLQAKNKLRKQLMHAEARAREAREAAAFIQLQREQQAYIDKMMPIWQKQAEMNAKFSIAAAKAAALQKMADTAEKKRQDDLYIQYERNRILQQWR